MSKKDKNDKRTKGQIENGQKGKMLKGQKDKGTKGQNEKRTKKDKRTKVQKDKTTKGQKGKRTKGQKDKRFLCVFFSSLLFVCLLLLYFLKGQYMTFPNTKHFLPNMIILRWPNGSFYGLLVNIGIWSV